MGGIINQNEVKTLSGPSPNPARRNCNDDEDGDDDREGSDDYGNCHCGRLEVLLVENSFDRHTL